MTARPVSYNFRSSWKPASTPRDHLSIDIPLDNVPAEKSQFSPESPPPTIHTASASTMNDSRKDLESARGMRSPRSGGSGGFRDRFTTLFFDIRTLGREPEMMPIQPPHLAEWPPLRVENKSCCWCHDQDKKRRKKKKRLWLILWAIFVIFVFSNLVFLDVRSVSLGTSPHQITSPMTSTASPSSSAILSVDEQQCLSQYTLNAPANPSSYPCSSCLPVLQGIPSNFSSADPSDGQQVVNGIQFCGLKGLFDSADSAGQTTFQTLGWFNDTRFCAWSGVNCDGSGRVSSLQLMFPGVPTLLPNELGALTGMQSLEVIGNNVMPAGSLPSSFVNLTSLTTLHLESTAITALPDAIFSSLSNITTLTLIDNSNMGQDLPSSLALLHLQSLVVNGQPLNSPLSNLTSSSSLQSSLQLLDLSSTSLTTSIPPTISSLSALTELHLNSNNIQPPLPSSFPGSLQVLALNNNTKLSGTISGGDCGGALKSCDVTGTGIQVGEGCAVCGA